MKRNALLFSLAAALMVAAFLDSQIRVVVSEYTAKSPKLPSAFEGYRIVQLSDLHGKEFGPNNRLLLQQVARLKPDLVAITGDLTDSTEDLVILDTLIPALCAMAPCCYVTGNHEWASGCADTVKSTLSEAGALVLDNQWVLIEKNGQSFSLGGVEDPNGPADMIKPAEFVDSYREKRPLDFTVLLGHRNYWLEEYPLLDVDLILCGHGHGGLIRLPGLGGLFGTNRDLLPRYSQGAIPGEHYTMVVSRGLGNSKGTFRLFNNPEIVVVNLKKI